MIQTMKQQLKEAIIGYYGNNDLNVVVEEPKRGNADLAVPLFALVKQLNKKMPELVEEISAIVLKAELIESATFFKWLFKHVYRQS